MIRVIFKDTLDKQRFIVKMSDLRKSYLDLTVKFDNGAIGSTCVMFINDEDVDLADYSCLVDTWDKCKPVCDVICDRVGV